MATAKQTLSELEATVRHAHAEVKDDRHQLFMNSWMMYRARFFNAVLEFHDAGGKPETFEGEMLKDVKWAFEEIGKGQRTTPPLRSRS
jgi:hypothetical protein